MQYLLKKLAALKNGISQKQLFLFLDYDGTIAPIAENPADAVMPRKMRDVICDLYCMKNVKVAIVSGRSLSDIKKTVGIKGLIYAGNHGLEIEGPGVEYTVKVPASTMELLQTIKRMLTFKLGSMKGVFIEDKDLAVALHFRNVDKRSLSTLNNYFNYIVQPYIMANRVDLLSGKMVYEIKPHVDWNKGNAVMWLLSKLAPESGTETTPVYIGDDVTDESVFKCLEESGMTVYVGEHSRSAAKYYLKNTDEVFELLKVIREVLSYE